MITPHWLTPIHFGLPRKHRAIWRRTPIDDLQQRALRILKGRARSDIEAAAEWIQNRLREARDSHNNEILFTARCTIITPARQLLIVLRQVDLGTLGHMRAARRCDYFATLALQFSSKVIVEWVPKLKDSEMDRVPIVNQITAHEWLREAAEAVLVAEALAEGGSSSGDDQPVRFLRSANRSAANSRHTPARAIKEQFASYVQGKSRSRAELAQRFYNQLTPTAQKQLCPSGNVKNAVRTLTAYLTRRL